MLSSAESNLDVTLYSRLHATNKSIWNFYRENLWFQHSANLPHTTSLTEMAWEKMKIRSRFIAFYASRQHLWHRRQPNIALQPNSFTIHLSTIFSTLDSVVVPVSACCYCINQITLSYPKRHITYWQTYLPSPVAWVSSYSDVNIKNYYYYYEDPLPTHHSFSLLRQRRNISLSIIKHHADSTHAHANK